MTETTTRPCFGTGEFFQRDNHAPVTDELTEFDLPVEGAIPAELDGWYLRNGPNPRQATAHWFTGDGMIHGVRIEGGRAAWYRNRWVRTDSFNEDFPLYNADGTRNLRPASPTPTSSTTQARRWRWSNRRCPTRSPTTWRRWAPTTSAASWSTR